MWLLPLTMGNTFSNNPTEYHTLSFQTVHEWTKMNLDRKLLTFSLTVVVFHIPTGNTKIQVKWIVGTEHFTDINNNNIIWLTTTDSLLIMCQYDVNISLYYPIWASWKPLTFCVILILFFIMSIGLYESTHTHICTWTYKFDSTMVLYNLIKLSLACAQL